MKPKVAFISEADIEGSALRLLADYGRKFGHVLRPPVPVEQILESHLQLSFGLDDLPRLLKTPGVMGAIWVRDRKVLIDESLDPSIDQSREGRYRFTVSHEVGHWELHRHHFLIDEGQAALFPEIAQSPIVCRSGSKDPMEWQADFFAGCLLMPKKLVIGAWEAARGSKAPYVAADEIADLNARWGLGNTECPTVDVARRLANEFKVSGQAMQIRLVGLGLIKPRTPSPGLFPM